MKVAETDKNSRIVVGVDGSTASLAALAWAADEAALRGARLIVVRAWLPEHLPPYASTLGRPTVPEIRERAGDELAEAAKAVKQPVEPVLICGPAARVMLEEAQGAALLVLGGHRSDSPLDHTVGGVTAACLRQSPCPVVIIAPAELRRDPRFKGNQLLARIPA